MTRNVDNVEPSPSRDEDYRVKLYKAASRSAHDEVERAAATLGDRFLEDREREQRRRETDLRDHARR